jgi:hypothetical protein
VPRDINESDPNTFQFHVSKAQIDCNPPAFFFGEAICIDTSQCLNQCGLAMIDVTTGSQHEVWQGRHL